MNDVQDRDLDSAGAAPDGAPTAIVGIGVCAASLRALETMFGGLDPRQGAAYVIAVRQKEGLDVASVVSVVARQSSMPVRIGQDGEALRPDHIYVGGADDMVTIADGHLAIRPATGPVGHRGTIDTMLISLAEHAHERAVAILLHGLGSDGTAGVTATKKHGGLSIAEAVAEDEANGAQGGAGPIGVVDLHVPAGDIGEQVSLYLRNIALINQAQEAGGVSEHVETQVAQITTILRNVTGHDFHGYKRGTFLRRVHRRLQVLHVALVDDYIARLRGDRDEVQNLFQDLLIGVTQFFRDPQEFDLLEAEIPRLVADKGPDEQFRVWVLGCATGEEAYSIAILLREHLATLAQPPQVQIFATDLDARALGLARAGRYAGTIAAHVRPDRLERWFVREGDTYCVSKELREMCIFSPHNVIKDAPFSRVDILSCRNLLIYLNADLQNRVIPIFHFALRPNGVLFLGNSENLSRHQKLFAPVDRKNRVFRRLDTAMRIVPDFPLSPRTGAVTADLSSPEKAAPPRLATGLNRQVETITERYAPAYVVIDNHGDVLHFSGRTGRFLEPVAGSATLNIVSLVHRDLRVDLRAAIQRAISDGRRIEVPRLAIRQEDDPIGVDLIVEPMGNTDITSLVVLFRDTGTVAGSVPAGDQPQVGDKVERLEAELRVTRDRLQATIEELESTNEELKSSNEEYQSINEELQSANEEMETSKEELQSVNEELQTVNGELAHRVSELGRTNSDLKNLLEATRIATLFLDNDLRVRSFTPTVTDIFHLLETDVGRPLDHVVSRVDYPDLQDDIRRVLRTLVPVERTVIDPASHRQYAARVLPYRSIDNYISGVVVTFTDLTAVHDAQTALIASERRLQLLLSAGWQGTYRMNADWSGMTEMQGGDFLADTQGSTTWLDRQIPGDERPRVLEGIAAAIRDKRAFEMEHRIRRVDGSTGWALSRAVPIIEGGEIVEWFGAASDITARREAEQALRESEERLQSLMQGLPQLVWRAIDGGDWSWASRQWTEYTGLSEADSHGLGWLDAVHAEDHPIARAAWEHATADRGFEVEYRIRRVADGQHRWFRIGATPVVDENGQIAEWIGTSTDIHDLRELRERQKVLVEELQHRTRNLMGVVRSMADKTARASDDLPDFRRRFRDRLEALSRVQGLLSRLNEHDRVTFHELIETELSAMQGDRDRVTVEGPPGVRLRSSMVQTLALAIHELATNAVKYGALSQAQARLAIRWRLDRAGPNGQPWLHIDWRESGVDMPPPGAAPRGTGQGRELIERALPYQLSAKTSYVLTSDGVHCTIAIPVSASTVGADEDG